MSSENNQNEIQMLQTIDKDERLNFSGCDIIYPLQKSLQEKLNQQNVCNNNNNTINIKDNTILNNQKNSAKLIKLGKENMTTEWADNTADVKLEHNEKNNYEEIDSTNQRNIEDINFDYYNLESMPVILGEDLELGFQEEVLATYEFQTPSEIKTEKKRN
ncbi:jg23097 [Pararge aegeria aegeria]|uniref:Jg23097 protein n=1 Tax=Pararge aegeria aegeria TaxID=348720 RepID=A0A8S4QU23_9NEOP|nr:jg23097 [Pararge aegeria aegeria]